jgi:hypothetical protein
MIITQQGLQMLQDVACLPQDVACLLQDVARLLLDVACLLLVVCQVETGDVVATFAYSHLVSEVLLRAHAAGRRFRAVVIDARPELEGRLTVKVSQTGGSIVFPAHC